MTVMTAMILIGFLIGRLLGWGQMDSIFLGGMLFLMSSTMIILKAYEEFGIKRKKFATLVLGTLVIEDTEEFYDDNSFDYYSKIIM